MGLVTFLNANAGAIGVIFSGLVSVATVVYAILTWRLVSETIRMRKAQTDANIAVGIETSALAFHALEFFVRNDGLGPAYDVRFVVRMEHPGTGDQEVLDHISKLGFIENGIGYFSPGQEMRSFVTTVISHFELKMATMLRVEAKFRTASGESRSESYLIDLSVFRNISQLGSPPLPAIAKSLKKIEDDVHHLSTGWSKLQVVTQDLDSLRADRREQELERFEQNEIERLAKQEDAGDGT